MTEALGLLLLLLICAAFARAALWYAEEPMDGAARNFAPGHFVGLREGVTHYRLDGPEGGPVLLCIHGLTTPSFVWDAMTPVLVAKGYRVLRFDLYGRGYSDRPWGRYNATRFTDQAIELLDALDIRGPITAMGYSMGGAVVTALARRHPARVKRLVLLAPGGLGHDLGRFSEVCAKVPVLGDWAFGTLGGWLMRRAAAREGDAGSAVPDLTSRIQEETWRRGYMRAVLSSQRRMLSLDQEEDHRALAEAGLPVFAIWGGADPVIPISAKDRLAAAHPEARQAVIEGAGHDLPTRHCAEVLRLLLG